MESILQELKSRLLEIACSQTVLFFEGMLTIADFDLTAFERSSTLFPLIAVLTPNGC